MPRVYARKLGGRNYQNYTQDNLRKAAEEVRANKLSVRNAVEKYGVPRATLHDKVKNTHPSAHGGQPVLTPNEERHLSVGLLKCSDWGFPLRVFDIQLLVQSYLNRLGRNEKRFKNNCPGVDWVHCFMKRHHELTLRFGENIKRARAAVDRNLLGEYFDNLETAIAGVPPSHIINYDETNFCDDPGKTKVIVRRGIKHPEVIKDTSKTSTSVMIAASGDGHVLPPYTVYKAQHLYPTWIEGGVNDARYNRNPSGWFDMDIFEDWFMRTCVPYFQTLHDPSPKVMIGDNLASHISIEVIRKCEELNIRFILLPPNSTHLCQPLDVAFFRLLKQAWRKCLDLWKRKNRGVLPKNEFPRMLKMALESTGNSKENVISGFKATGIIPLNRDRVLSRVPHHDPAEADRENAVREGAWTNAFVEMLQEARIDSGRAKKAKPRGKKLNIQLGKSVGLRDLGAHQSDDSDSGEVVSETDLSQSESSDISPSDDERDLTDQPEDEQELTGPPVNRDFVIVKFTTNRSDRFFVGLMVYCPGINDGDQFRVRFMRKKEGVKQSYFSFPDVEDEGVVQLSQIVRKLHIPKDIRRGRYVFSDIGPQALKKVE